MKSSKDKFSVGILGNVSPDWVAGAIYTLNLHRVLHSVSEETGVFPNLIHAGFHRLPTGLATSISDSTFFFSHIQNQKELKIRQLAKRLISKVNHPRSKALESIVRAEQIKVLYPGLGIEANIGCKQVHWIPDFQHLRLPENFPGQIGIDRNRYVDGLLERSDAIFLSSQDALNDAREFRPQYVHKLYVLPFVLSPDDAWFNDPPEESIEPFTGGREYLIFPSQSWVHKGHKVLIRALAILKEDYQLDVLTLCPGYQNDYRFPNHFQDITRLIQELDVSDNIRFLGLLDRHLLMQLMRGSKAVVQPSRFEGWSALLEDAQGLGKPIIASDIPVHREQDPPDTIFFNDGDPESLADVIAKEWSQLPPGFDPERETEGRAAQEKRVREFGAYFANLLRTVDQEISKPD